MTISMPLESSFHGSRILIVDDSETERSFLQSILKERGYQQLFLAENAEQALRDFDKLNPDLVILDLVMPGMDGFQCCHKIRQKSEGKDLPILIQTAMTEPDLRLKAFHSGATDYLSKPILPEELCARILVHLEKSSCIRKLKEYHDHVERQLDSARALQHGILPSSEDITRIEAQCGLEVASHFEPSSHIGGDFWGMKLLSPNQLAFWVVDFSGHGFDSALNAFRLQAYLMEPSPLANRPGEYLMQLNEKLLNLLLRGQFATMFYAVIDLKSDQLLFASAGSPYPILQRQQGSIDIMNVTGRPLGITLHRYHTHTISFKPGDALFFYSDALTETPDAKGEFLHEEVLAGWLASAKGPSTAVMESIVSQFRRHAEANKCDDLTLGYIRRH